MNIEKDKKMFIEASRMRKKIESRQINKLNDELKKGQTRDQDYADDSMIKGSIKLGGTSFGNRGTEIEADLREWQNESERGDREDRIKKDELKRSYR